MQNRHVKIKSENAPAAPKQQTVDELIAHTSNVSRKEYIIPKVKMVRLAQWTRKRPY